MALANAGTGACRRTTHWGEFGHEGARGRDRPGRGHTFPDDVNRCGKLAEGAGVSITDDAHRVRQAVGGVGDDDLSRPGSRHPVRMSALNTKQPVRVTRHRLPDSSRPPNP